MSGENVGYIGLIGPALGIIVLAIAGAITGAKKPPAAEHAEVVAATFTDRSLMQQLICALDATCAAVVKSTEKTDELVGLLEADAHRREVEAEVRQALKDRGLIP